jgi:hypothetical protein
MKALTSGNVKVFGCRPRVDGAATAVAGVRKPPREETALGKRVTCRVHYGDLSTADNLFEGGRHA